MMGDVEDLNVEAWEQFLAELTDDILVGFGTDPHIKENISNTGKFFPYIICCFLLSHSVSSQTRKHHVRFRNASAETTKCCEEHMLDQQA